MSAPMKPDDPAYWMIERGRRNVSKRSTTTVYKEGCYICEDHEFSLMGLPLCFPCAKCGGHVPADDCFCDACGTDVRLLTPGGPLLFSPDHDPGDEDRKEVFLGPWCSKCGQAFDAPSLPCPTPHPGTPYIDCGRGGHMFVEDADPSILENFKNLQF